MTHLERDLLLIGYQLRHSMEGCQDPGCHYLDLGFDVDALASGPDGDILVSHRDQSDGDYDMDTVTIREIRDNGSRQTQLAKVYSGKSRADIYVNGYASGVAYITSDSLLDALQTKLFEACPRSQPDPGHIWIGSHKGHQPCSGGQTMAVFCPECADVHYLPRAS